jgi:Flp pilus assembly pilin Flp
MAMIQALNRCFRALIIEKDNRGLENLEYAVFAASFLFFVAGAANLLKSNVNTAYNDIGQFVLKQASKM